MHRFKRLITALFLTVLSIILLFSVSMAYLIVTPWGGKILVRYFKKQFVSVGLMHIGHYQGSLQDGFILKDVRIIGMTYFPDALIRVQEIHVRLPLWDPSHAVFDIFNARIFMPDSDPVVFTGNVYAGEIKGNLYAKSVDIHSASRFWTNEDIRKNLQGFISDLDVNIKGPFASPRVSGHFMADSIRYESTTLSDGISKIDLTFLPDTAGIQVKGIMTVDSGLVNVRNTKLELSPSQIIFHGDFFNPTLNIRLGAKVEDMDIHLAIKGDMLNPQLIVSSDPPMAPQKALQILFTGNALMSSTSPFRGATSGELAENFLDYSLRGKNDDQDLGLKTKLTDNLKLGVEMDKTSAPLGENNIYYSRKINGEMDMTEHMSLNVSREIFTQERDPTQAAPDSQTEPDTQIYLQYKKRF